MSITITPTDAIKLENLTAETLWKEVSIPFIKRNIPAGNLNRPIGARCLKMLRGIAKKDKIKESTIKRGSCPALRGKLKGDKKDADRSAKQPKERVKEAQEGKEKQKKMDLEGLLLNILGNNKADREKIVAGQTHAVDNVLIAGKQPMNPNQQMMGGYDEREFGDQPAGVPFFYAGLGRPKRQDLMRNAKIRQAVREGRMRWEAKQEGSEALREADEKIAEARGKTKEQKETIKRFLAGNDPKPFEFDSEEEWVLGEVGVKGKMGGSESSLGENTIDDVMGEDMGDVNFERFAFPRGLEEYAFLSDSESNASSRGREPVEEAGGQFGGGGAGFNLPAQGEIWDAQQGKWITGRRPLISREEFDEIISEARASQAERNK